jgi:hypothetical protein
MKCYFTGDNSLLPNGDRYPSGNLEVDEVESKEEAVDPKNGS